METQDEFTAREEALVTGIWKAFDAVSRGDGPTLHEAIVIDRHGTEAQRSAARLLDVEDRWQDVSADAVTACQ